MGAHDEGLGLVPEILIVGVTVNSTLHPYLISSLLGQVFWLFRKVKF